MIRATDPAADDAAVCLRVWGAAGALRETAADCARERALDVPKIYYFRVAREVRRILNCSAPRAREV